jgi:hypothetical protein
MPINPISSNTASSAAPVSTAAVDTASSSEVHNPQKAPRSLAFRAVTYLGKGFLAATMFCALALLGLGKISFKAAIAVGKALSSAIKRASESNSDIKTTGVSLKSAKPATKPSPASASLKQAVKESAQEKKAGPSLSGDDQKDIAQIQARLDRLRDKPAAKSSPKSDPFKNSTLGGAEKLSTADQQFIAETQARLQANKGIGPVEKDDAKFIADVQARLKNLKD